MHLLQQILFLLLSGSAVYLFTRNAGQIRRNILLGTKQDMSDNKPQRIKNLMLLALGQKVMFRKPLVALMHLVVYAGFIIVNIEVLEIVLDGLLGTHRLFFGALGGVYIWLINAFECLAVLVIIVCVGFLTRRNILKIRRFLSHDLDGWPRSDANYILLFEIALMLLFLSMNATDTLLQQRNYGHYGTVVTGDFLFSSLLHPIFHPLNNISLALTERVFWWMHIAGIFTFLNYLPYSKHLHILLAFPNAYYAPLTAKGKMENMQAIQNEVLYAMQPELAPASTDSNAEHQKFGAKDVFDLSWKNLLDAYTCTECGRCTAVCPANITGKLLSPRKIMMDTRDRLEEVGKNINAVNSNAVASSSVAVASSSVAVASSSVAVASSSVAVASSSVAVAFRQRTLLHDYISPEELRACTTCYACVEECPVSISPVDIILQLRRYLVMEESNAPQEWNSMFSNIENNAAPWKFSPDDREGEL